MQKLKAEMLILGKHAGDAGTSESQAASIDAFLESVQTYLTEAMLETMLPGQVRVLYAHWIGELIRSGGDKHLATQSLAARVWVATTDRTVVEAHPSNNVVSIFNSLTHH